MNTKERRDNSQPFPAKILEKILLSLIECVHLLQETFKNPRKLLVSLADFPELLQIQKKYLGTSNTSEVLEKSYKKDP